MIDSASFRSFDFIPALSINTISSEMENFAMPSWLTTWT